MEIQANTQKTDQVGVEKNVIRVTKEGNLAWDLTNLLGIEPYNVFKLIAKKHNVCYIQFYLNDNYRNHERTITRIIVKCDMNKDDKDLVEFAAVFKKAIEKIYSVTFNTVTKRYDGKDYYDIKNKLANDYMDIIAKVIESIANLRNINSDIYIYCLSPYFQAFLVLFK